MLYPEDNHYEGKSLRLKQQYFFVSATMQSITRQHIQTYGTLKNFHEKNVIQINDTHPALVIPELMRILVDDAGLSWDEAWHITTCSVAYTNHTVLAEALERWPQQLFETLLPRVWQILQEIARRWQEKVESFYHDPRKDRARWRSSGTAWCGWPTSASPAVMAVNGVSRSALGYPAHMMCSGTPAAWSRRSSRTSPTAWITAAGSARSTPVWTG